MATTSKTLNPYTAARQEWDERYGDLISRAKHWRLIAFLSMTTTLVCVTGMVTIGYRSHTVPYVVALDEVGRAVPVVPAKQVAVKDVRLQEATVARWITNLRTVVIDPVVQRKMVDEVYALASASSAASQTLTDWYQQNSPFSRLQRRLWMSRSNRSFSNPQKAMRSSGPNRLTICSANCKVLIAIEPS